MEQNTPTSGKGKAKEETRDEKSLPSNSSQVEKSMASRIVSSASALAKDAVGSSNGHVPAILSSSSTLGNKSQSSGPSSGPSAWADTVSARPSAPVDGAGNNQSQGMVQESFRTQKNPESDVLAEFDFDKFLADSDGFNPHSGFEQYYPETSSWTQEFKANGDEPVQSLNSREETASQHGHMKFENLDQYDDGAEVRMLLSDPSFNAFTDTFDMMRTPEPTEASVNDLFPQMFSPEEQSAADRIRSTLPAPPVHRPVPAAHPLNLRPRSEEEKETLQQEINDLATIIDSGSQNQMSFASQSQREHWVAEWDDVLNSYSDEVWGNMLPAVKAAKSQLEEVRAGATTVDAKAIARLKMILGHVNTGPSMVNSTFSHRERRIEDA
jgi:hypothetical protein